MKIAYQLIEKIDSLNSEELINDGLLSGKLGLVYYYLSLYKHFKEDKYLQKIQATLETIFSNIENEQSHLVLSSSLEDGLSGLGYILSLLIEEQILDQQDYAEEIEQINTMAFQEAMQLLEAHNYDFIRGPFGILYYLNHVKATVYVDEILQKIQEKCDEDASFLFYNNDTYIEGIHIGYAHGLCAIVKVLNDIEDEKAISITTKILNKLVDYVNENEVFINQKRYFLPRSIHNSTEFPNGLNFRAVLAWSNSDVNFSTLIYSLKKELVNPKLLKMADEIALTSLDRIDASSTRVWDHRFYYGSSGVLKSYNYLYTKTGNPKFKEASAFWYQQTLHYLENNTITEHPLDFINNLPATTLTLLEFEEQKNTNWSNIVLL